MAGQAFIMKKWLRGDNYVDIQDRIIGFLCTALSLNAIYL